MKPLPTLLAALALLALPSCTSGGTDAAAPTFDFNAASEVISQKTARFTESHITGDQDFLNGVFADDARVYPPGSDRIASHAEIEAINAQYVEYGISEFTEVSTHRYGGPEIIVDEGTYTMTYGPDSTSEAGHYINIWKQVGGDWKLYANTWTVLPGGAE